MTTAVDVANMALMQIGSQSSVSSVTVTDNSAEGNAVCLLYQPMIDNIMRAAHWDFARTQASLTLLRAAMGTQENPDGTLYQSPPQPWNYEYRYPADCLKLRFIQPLATTVVGIPFTTVDNTAPLSTDAAGVKFVKATNTDPATPTNWITVVQSNAAQAQAVYTRRVTDPNLWDPNFLIAASSYLGAWLINALARNRAQWNDQMKIAMDIIAAARVTDGNEGLTSQEHLPDWIRIRGASSFTPSTFYFQTYDTIVWPNGSTF